MKKNIIWLASYPKSGNTWTRIFLANYLTNAPKPMPINQVHRLGIGDSIAKTYHMVAGRQIDVHDIPLTLRLRDKVLRGVVGNKADVNFVKTHNIRGETGGVRLIPAEYTRSALYILRNPLDMVLSYARHYGISHERAVQQITHHDNANSADAKTVAQFLGSWSDHVKSWTSPSPYPVLVLRYEDLLADPETHFARVLKLIGVPVDPERLTRAIGFSSFKELSKQEADSGFIERPDVSKSFFTSGTSGKWQTELAPELVEKIIASEGKMMKKHGYLE